MGIADRDYMREDLKKNNNKKIFRFKFFLQKN